MENRLKLLKHIPSTFQKRLHLGKKAMKNQSLLSAILLVMSLHCWSQEKTNPIIFTEFMLGYAGGSSQGLASGINLNYQTDNHLLTLRYNNVTEFKTDFFLYIPIASHTIEQVDDIGLLYGRRKIQDNFSYSYSAGIALVKKRELISEENDNFVYEKDQAVGVPFEFSIKWFNREKERYRIYCLIPVGKPISFSRSIGFKFFGNVSKTTYMGLGLTYGFGWHKNY